MHLRSRLIQICAYIGLKRVLDSRFSRLHSCKAICSISSATTVPDETMGAGQSRHCLACTGQDVAAMCDASEMELESCKAVFANSLLLDEDDAAPKGLTDKEVNNVRLLQAVMRDEVEIARRAIQDGADINTTVDFRIAMGSATGVQRCSKTPLMRACEEGFGDLVLLLLESKANLVKRDERGWTALCYALSVGETDIARRVLDDAGANAPMLLSPVRRAMPAIVQKCEATAGEEAAEQVASALLPGGFLSDKK
eukprot:TRINITY_DN111734_c0_g1_i1.p1 TRINITY_DN111734_c0_g1~~TRINITY_DN111734_c0_g1_i1.p1  ORF type:complete len:274 (-),score=57.81 TRINITY_DN111734_c0_g1_i1:199-960(-)